MTPEQRLELIRAKVCRAMPAPYAAAGLKRAKAKLPPRPPKPPPYVPKGFGWVHPGYGGYNGIREQPVIWVAEPKQEPEKPRVAPKKRRKGKHYLSEIAEKMPGKLPMIRKYFRSDYQA